MRISLLPTDSLLYWPYGSFIVLNGTTTLFKWSRIMSKSCGGACGGDATSAADTDIQASSEAPGEMGQCLCRAEMDCPSEERMIRLALNGFEEIRRCPSTCRTAGWRSCMTARSSPSPRNWRPGARRLASGNRRCKTGPSRPPSFRQLLQKQRIRDPALVAGINALLFVVEMTAGLIAQSTGLIGESWTILPMRRCTGLPLYAVGHSVKMPVRAAHLAGVLQLILAVGVLVEVVRRFVFGSEPESLVMMAIAFVALIANTSCLLLISKHREGGAHEASWIFSANDVVINLGSSPPAPWSRGPVPIIGSDYRHHRGGIV